MEDQSAIAADVLGRYASDAAREVAGVLGVADRSRPRQRGVRVLEQDGSLAVDLRVAVDWGADTASLGEAVQRRVAEYLGRMSGRPVRAVTVTIDDVAAPPAA
jgi:uncharacterized alkaline shock family protein YloU